MYQMKYNFTFTLLLQQDSYLIYPSHIWWYYRATSAYVINNLLGKVSHLSFWIFCAMNFPETPLLVQNLLRKADSWENMNERLELSGRWRLWLRFSGMSICRTLDQFHYREDGGSTVPFTVGNYLPSCWHIPVGGNSHDEEGRAVPTVLHSTPPVTFLCNLQVSSGSETRPCTTWRPTTARPCEWT